MIIILASTSSIRKQLLTESGIKFEAIAPLCDEDELKKHLQHLQPLELSLELAKAKAKSVSDKFPDAHVIGSDQICSLGNEIISKSANEEEAFESLKKLSGKTHYQNNGTCIFLNSKSVMEHSEKAELTMKNLTDEEIKNYIKLDNPIGCAGSYKYELNGKNLFSKITGTKEAILGFAINKVNEFFSGR